MKRVLFFINTLQGGGAEKVLVNLLTTLDKKQYEITLVTVSGGIYQKQLPTNVKYRQLISGNSWLSKQLIKIIYHLPYSVVNRLVSNGQYDVEIAYLEGFPTRVIAAGRGDSQKIAFVHCDVSITAVLNSFYPDNRSCLNEYATFNKVCFVSKAAKEGFESTIGKLDNAEVVRNVINEKEIAEKAKENMCPPFDTDGMKIVCVGRLAKEKAFDRVIRIAADLEKKFNFQIFILGEGNQREYLEELIAERNVKSVQLLGFMSNPYPYIKSADLLVCSSLFEGYSTVVAESVLLGTPVLTTRCAGMDELLKNSKYGLIVENTEAALKAGLIKMLSTSMSDKSKL